MNNRGWKKIPWRERESTKNNIAYAKACFLFLAVILVLGIVVMRVQHSTEKILSLLFSCMALAYYIGYKNKR